MKEDVRTRYPNPQFRREYVSLNGEWDFEICNDVSDLEDFTGGYSRKIQVPYCPESALSGIGYTDFITACRYRRKFFLAAEERRGKRIFLHFGAVDYISKLYINERFVGENTGGYVPFSFDITEFLQEGENEISLLVVDEKTYGQPRGKQAYMQKPFGCFYTRTTGIWQSVWLERVAERHVVDVKFTPDIHACSVRVEANVCGEGKYSVEIFYKGALVGRASGECVKAFCVDCPLTEKHLWGVNEGNLYDVVLRFEEDRVDSYFGLREVRFDGRKFLLNGEAVFQRLVLDQGFYPKGIYTPPTEEELIFDIQVGQELGFNGARLHQKIFDPLYLYHCDRLGYMVWGEYPSWGIDFSSLQSYPVFIEEWKRVLERDYNHPSIVTWCPLNEVWGNWQNDGKTPCREYVEKVYAFTKAYDPSRPCIDVSGGFHGKSTDVFDFHCYEECKEIEKVLDRLEEEDVLFANLLYPKTEKDRVLYTSGQPVMLSECGGFTFTERALQTSVATVNDGAVTCEEGWGYGEGAVGEENFIERYSELMNLIYGCSKLSGFCYTQLYDVEQEQNGFLTYSRTHKLSEEGRNRIRKINQMKAKIERDCKNGK